MDIAAGRHRAGRQRDHPTYLPSSDLRSGIQYRQRNGLDASEFEENYWGRWFYPLNVLALCLAAMPFAFGSLRSGGLGKRLFIGIVFALGFWFAADAVRETRRRLQVRLPARLRDSADDPACRVHGVVRRRSG